jgi:hypothetical protein
MSSRAPIGASTRPDLFAASDQCTARTTVLSRCAGVSQTEDLVSVQRDDDPLQLEHVIGFLGQHLCALFGHPTQPNKYLKRYVEGHEAAQTYPATAASGLWL